MNAPARRACLLGIVEEERRLHPELSDSGEI
jgi:hypothetical protein